MALRYAGQCAVCGLAIGKGERAYWDADAKLVYCLRHQPSAQSDPPPPARPHPWEPRPPGEPPTIDVGVAGRSVQREYERRVKRRENDVRARHPHIGGLVLALSNEPQSIEAWAHGGIGEREIGKVLDSLVGRGVIALHDRKMPYSSANIDHIAIGPSGIYVIDAKYRESGRVEQRGSGSILRPGPPQLWVGRRNCTPLVAKMAKQVDAVTRALDRFGEAREVPVRPVLAFVHAEWGPFDRPIDISGVLAVSPKELRRVVGRSGTLSTAEVRGIAERLESRLKPA